MEYYPEEILKAPIPIVLFLSPDPSQIEKIVQNFSIKRVGLNEERPLFKIKNEKWGHHVPMSTERRESFENYKPRGIIKTEWLFQNFHELPSVIVVFIEWSERSERSLDMWRNKLEKEVSTVLDSIQQSTKWSKSLKIIIVLLHNESIPVTDPSNDERVMAISKFTEPKNIIYFALQDIINYTKRLEKLIIKFSTEYYKTEIQSIKKYKDLLPKINQSRLYVTYHFQCAYLYEFLDNIKGIIFYQIGYNYLKDMRKMRNELDEVKLVADFLNYKICKLFLESGQTQDAINHFLRHISYYKILVQDPDLEFQHWEWVSRQYILFGQLLLLHLNKVPPGPSYYHPGYFFQAAATSQIERRKAWEKLGKPLLEDTNVIELKDKVEPYNSSTINRRQQYVGQNLEKVALKEDSLDKKYKYLHIAIAQESLIEHVSITTSLLQLAYDQYSMEENQRIASLIEIDLATEYRAAGKYDKAMSYLEKFTGFFEREGWWDILTSILQNSLLCAQGAKSIEDILRYTFKLLRPNLTISEEERKSLQLELQKILFSDIQLTSPVEIALTYEHPLLSCKMEFPDEVGYINVNVNGKLHIYSSLPIPIEFCELILNFVDTDIKHADRSSMDQKASPISISGPITIYPNIENIVPFQMIRSTAAIVDFNTIRAKYGNSMNCIIFKWDTTNWPKISTTMQARLNRKYIERTNIRVLEYATTINIDLLHHPPALVNEFYKVDIKIENPMNDVIINVIAHLEFKKEKKIDLEDPQFDDNLQCIYTYENNEKILCSTLNINKISPKEIVTKSIYILQSIISTDKYLEVKVKYETEKYAAITNKKISVPVKHPFRMVVDFYDKRLEPLNSEQKTQPKAGEQFLLGLETIPVTPFPIKLIDISLFINNDPNHTPIAKFFGTSIPDGGVVLEKSNKHSTWFHITSSHFGIVKLGYFIVSWMRKGSGSDDKMCQTTYQVPAIEIDNNLITTEFKHETFGNVGQPFTVTVYITNRTRIVQDFELKVHENEYFLFAGDKRSFLSVNPTTTIHAEYSFVPLFSGKLSLPRFDIVATRSSYTLETTFDRYIFVKPMVTDKILASPGINVGML